MLNRVFNIYQSVFLHKTDFLVFLWSVSLRGTCFLVLSRVFFLRKAAMSVLFGGSCGMGA